MTAIAIDQVSVEVVGPGLWKTSARIHGAGIDCRLWYTSTHAIGAPAEVFVAAALLPAMATGQPLRVDVPISPLFRRNLEAIQEILIGWHPRLHRVRVQASEATPHAPEHRGRAAFFSGGVDSFATVQRHRDTLTHLVLVRGFDIALSDESLWAEVSSRIAQAAAALQLPLIRVETNIRQLLDGYGDWGEVTHGAALASVGHLFADSIETVLVPGTHHIRDLFPWGSHPLLDPLWSTETLRLVNDGFNLTRIEKTALIAGDEAARRHLRVCWENRGGAYNCGRCDKCVRTMIALALANAAEQFQIFPPLDDERLASLFVDSENTAAFARENLVRAREVGREDIAGALEYALWRFEARHSLLRTGRSIATMPVRAIARRLLAGRRP